MQNQTEVSSSDFFVNILPILNRVPDWFPGTGWKQTARTWRANKERAVDEPYEWTKAQVVSIIYINNF